MASTLLKTQPRRFKKSGSNQALGQAHHRVAFGQRICSIQPFCHFGSDSS
ncbi:MAG: hypothetical protein OXS32_08595 [Verrucomicrobiales bacterium]|nr:hypothetical protein [Verrucomicrobiales bacterium]